MKPLDGVDPRKKSIADGSNDALRNNIVDVEWRIDDFLDLNLARVKDKSVL